MSVAQEYVFKSRPPKQGNLVKNEGIAVYAECRDSWFRKTKYRKILPPWAKLRYGTMWARTNRPALWNTWVAFARVSSATGGFDRWSRRRAIAEALRGKNFGGKPKAAKAISTDINAAIAAAKRAV